MPLPVDDLLPDAHAVYHRCVGVRAPAGVLFGWLCQLRVAPYSYDLIDNFGRRSPRERDPSLRKLEAGQRVMTIFTLLSFDDPSHLTLRLTSKLARRIFGEIALTYAIVPVGEDASRLVARLRVRYPRAPFGWLMRIVLPPGDLVMMRRQLLNLRDHAEREHAVVAAAP
jgi:hypothetical protein